MVCFSFFRWDGAFELYLCLPLQTQMWFANEARAEVCLQARGSPKFFLPWQKASIHLRCVRNELYWENLQRKDTKSVSFLFCFGWDGCYLAPSSLLAMIWFVSKSKAIGVLAHQGLDADHFSQEKCSHPLRIDGLFFFLLVGWCVRTIFVFAFANTNVVRSFAHKHSQLASVCIGQKPRLWREAIHRLFLTAKEDTKSVVAEMLSLFLLV